MGGCTNCKAKTGCDDRKGDMLASIDRTLDELYPTRTWGEAREQLDAGISRGELDALADELASVLGAATFVREGDDGEACDFLYVLCMGRTPCLVQVRDHGVLPDVENAEELYLRVAISHRARIAAVQQVAIELRDARLVRERPRAGVYDAPLLPRMQKLVATLPAYDLMHVDFGEIAHAPPGYHAGAWRELYGGEPAIANYLFYAQPTTLIVTSVLP